MALSSDTKWTIGVGASVLAAIGWTVMYLTGLQTEMENRLSGNITAAENRLAQRIDGVDSGLEGVDSRLRAVEQKTSALAGVEDRLSQQVATAENRLAEDIRNVEDRLIAYIDKLEARVGTIEQTTSTLASITPGYWGSTWKMMSPQTEGSIAKVSFDDLYTSEAFDPEKFQEVLKEVGIQADFVFTPVPTTMDRDTAAAILKQYIDALQKADPSAESTLESPPAIESE